MSRLTKRRLGAISEALKMRLAGEIDSSSPPREDYERALSWADQELARRSSRRGLGRLVPMPWCDRCQSYHHDTAGHINPGKADG